MGCIFLPMVLPRLRSCRLTESADFWSLKGSITRITSSLKFLPSTVGWSSFSRCRVMNLVMMFSSRVTGYLRRTKVFLRRSHSSVKKFWGKYECFLYEMLFIKELKPNLNKQSDSIRSKLFNILY